MQIHSLDLDNFYDDEFSLLGIHTTLEDFKLAYLLNKILKTSFHKSRKDLVFKGEKNSASFSLFSYTDKEYDFDWSLIANSSKRENQTVSNELLLTSETKTYLIAEKKKVDFFLKISGETPYNFVSKIANKIKTIEQVITSYPIDKHTLKSRDFLIF